MTVPSYLPGKPALAYDRTGQGPAVIFLHGIGGNRSSWRTQGEALSGHFTTIAWDARGYGASDDYDGPLDFASFAADLVRLLDHLKIEKAHLVGLSMGARILMDFFPNHGERAATMTLCDCFSGFEATLTPDKQAEFIRLRQKPLLEGKSLAEMAPALVKSLVGPNCSDDGRAALTESILALHVESYLKTIAASVGFDRSNDVSAIDVPVQLIYGEHDRLTPPAIGETLLEKIADARLGIVEDAGHLSNLEQPDRFNGILAPFLDQHASLATSLTL
ncbi:MAG: alpha/beta fold hydrolase [Alphaproteobacteria bacterium]|nr:alpha/beta fold hydrolase [Alphaproteobacteria bacterium]MBT4965993.1 alpha/beta fold hydrolase [Alphaproteobacteria bacterium]MBT5160879.1 alpha/beta fold hydrolase [Alphaproteobacteria bacterium]MBT5918265.1 alpha/beta fold hydrolase [Alphaproteobacteria bacterium]MBT6385190.1 alpha/beta fold hydrolase [Alphaproteobacteria bacterium]